MKSPGVRSIIAHLRAPSGSAHQPGALHLISRRAWAG